jgi:hypothetical protein
VERFGAAAAQLGDHDVAVRIAGVYAMAGVADESSNFTRRQQCIDVLCGYLRLPYDPKHGTSHLTQQTRRVGPDIKSTEDTYRYRQNDRQVRQTIVRVITAHLQKDAETNWSHHDFDFTGVLFENASFSRARFSGYLTRFFGATFGGEGTSFMGATFSGRIATFAEATFSGDLTSFDFATFSGSTSFYKATFSGDLTSFDVATFSGKRTNFEEAKFSGKRTSFEEAKFSGKRTIFEEAKFSGALVNFRKPRAWNNVHFDWDENPDKIPKGVQPREWPPKVVRLGSESRSEPRSSLPTISHHHPASE